MKVTDFTVELVQRNAVVSFIEKHHYSHNVNGIQSYYHFGLFKDGKFGLPEMIGAMMYAMPSMPHTSKKYNPINPNIKGREILKKFGRKKVMLNLKNEFTKTSIKLKRIKNIPI